MLGISDATGSCSTDSVELAPRLGSYTRMFRLHEVPVCTIAVRNLQPSYSSSSSQACRRFKARAVGSLGSFLPKSPEPDASATSDARHEKSIGTGLKALGLHS